MFEHAARELHLFWQPPGLALSFVTSQNQPSLFDSEDSASAEFTNESVEFVYQRTDLTKVEVKRSKRAKRNVTAYRDNDKTVVTVPTRMAKRDVDAYVTELVNRLDDRDERTSSQKSLEQRARSLSLKYLGQDLLETHKVPVKIRWVTNQNSRWGSCTPDEGTIRLSHRMQRMPSYVIDSVIVHELIHLLVTDHSPAFYALMNKYPDHEKAKAYLDGYSHAQQFLKPE
ncbi:MAG: M48 family metallopeptidase [Candidatus Nanopelagicales bacterium]|nr:M48 family metallopeptidase [Candidatus Nanopelagicales bacterium]